MPKVPKLPKVPSAPKLKPRKPLEPLKPMQPLKAKMTDEELGAAIKRMNKENEIRKEFLDPAVRSKKLEELKMTRLKKTASQIADAVLVKMAAEDEEGGGVGAGERALRVGGGLLGGTATGLVGGSALTGLVAQHRLERRLQKARELLEAHGLGESPKEMRRLGNLLRKKTVPDSKALQALHDLSLATSSSPRARGLVRSGPVLAALAGGLGGAALGGLGGTLWGALSGGD